MVDVTWNALALPGIVSTAVGWLVAAFVYGARPRRPQNRLLAASLALFASFTFLLTTARLVLVDYADVRAAYVVSLLASTWALVLYVLFLGTIDVPASRWVRTRMGRALVVVYGAGLSVVVLGGGDALVGNPSYAPHLSTWIFEETALTLVAGTFPIVLAFLYGVVVAVAAYRRARTATLRRQAKAYATAFVLRDALTSMLVLLVAPRIRGEDLAMTLSVFVGQPFIDLLFFVLLGYGILQTHLFDIELRLKWTIRQGTLAAIFVAAFFVVSESAQQAFQGRIGPYLGIVAAGLLVFALAPLQRVAERVANVAMPHVEDTHAYRLERRKEIYRAALESAARDGVVTDRERDVLATLQEQLDLTATDALALEREVLREAAPVAAG